MKQIFTTALVLSGLIAYAQTEEDLYGRVGINTNTPMASLHIGRHWGIPQENPQGVLFPYFSTEERDTFTTAKLPIGLMLFNIDKKCIDWWNGAIWQCTDGSQKDYAPENTTDDESVEAQVWNRTHYIASFSHNGANIDGEISNTGTNALTLQIPYNQATVGGSYNEINITRTVQDRSGNSQTLTLYIPAGTFTEAKGFLTATIKVGNGSTDTYSVKHLPANTEELITSFKFKINGRPSTISLIASGGLLDKMFNIETNNKLEHQFIYVPISVYVDKVEQLPNSGEPYERKWLNNNLGANYAKVGANQHTQQATTHDDYNAYGSLFQWQRKADGHELIDWNPLDIPNSTRSNIVDGPLGDSNWIASHSNFIKGISTNNYSWVDTTTSSATTNKDLWQTNQPNNPCPTGFHVPTYSEWFGLITSMGGQDRYNYNSLGYTYWSSQNMLRLTIAGVRSGNINVIQWYGEHGIYWSSTNKIGTMSRAAVFSKIESEWNYANNSSGASSIRCIAD